MGDKLDSLVPFSAEALRAEADAISQLRGTAEKYLTAISILLGFHIVEIKDLTFCDGASKSAFSVVLLCGIILLLIAMAVAIWSMRVRVYPTYPKTDDLAPLRATATSDAAREMIVDINLALRDGILAVNEHRAHLLAIAGWLLMLGFVASVAGQIGLKLL